MEWAEGSVDFQPLAFPRALITPHEEGDPGASGMECPEPHGGGAEDIKVCADCGITACCERVAEPASVLSEGGRHQPTG
jgi:hypothetical protein